MKRGKGRFLNIYYDVDMHIKYTIDWSPEQRQFKLKCNYYINLKKNPAVIRMLQFIYKILQYNLVGVCNHCAVRNKNS